MSLTNDEWRELDVLKRRLESVERVRTEDYEEADKRHNAIMTELGEIKREVKLTNGRVTKLENVAQIGAVIQRAIYAVALVFAGAIATALAQKFLGGS